tara:strand:- start:1452 stop:1604 length:153 start_codon:yes stop_codon:yes gene_type:complete
VQRSEGKNQSRRVYSFLLGVVVAFFISFFLKKNIRNNIFEGGKIIVELDQ